MNIYQSLKIELVTLIKHTLDVHHDDVQKIEVSLNVDKVATFGDISCNAAMVLARKLQKNPREIAQTLIDALNAMPEDLAHLLHYLPEHIDKAEIAGPGFINLFFKPTLWTAISHELAEKKEQFFTYDPDDEKKRYLLEFVSANPTGPLHLGHGRGGIIGDVLANVLTFLGHHAECEFYINDAGNQIGKLAKSFKARCLQASGKDVPLPEDGYAGEYLAELAQECLDEHGDVATKDLPFFGDYAKAKLLERIKQTLHGYGIDFKTWFSEKTLHESGAIEKVLEDLKKKDLIYEQEGALWFKASQFGDDKDRVLKKADGAYTYIAPDIAYHKNKFDRNFDVVIDILGQDHHGYVNRLKGTMQALDYPAHNLDVILYQLVSIKAGGQAVKMSKRAGTFTELQDVIDAVGTDVARFFYLNRKAEAHLDFDLETALKKTDENPVFYIHYAYVRIKSILTKAAENSELTDFDGCTTEWGPAEFGLLKKMISLQGVLHAIEGTYQTHLLSYYTYELAQQFHHYYAANKVIDSEHLERSKNRLFIISLVHDMLGICLDLLELSKPEKM